MGGLGDNEKRTEKIFFDRVSTGAQDDLQKVTRLAYSIVTLYGMNDAIGNRSYPSNNQDGSIQHSRPYSEQTAELVDEEVRPSRSPNPSP